MTCGKFVSFLCHNRGLWRPTETKGGFVRLELRPCFIWVLVGLEWSGLDRLLVGRRESNPRPLNPYQDFIFNKNITVLFLKIPPLIPPVYLDDLGLPMLIQPYEPQFQRSVVHG